MSWVNKDTEIYCSFAKNAGNTGCQMMNTAFHYYGLNKIYKSFSVDNIEFAVNAVKTLNIKGFAITMPYKKEVLKYVDILDRSAEIGAANTVINKDGILKAYNTDYLAATDILKDFEKKGELYILGNGGYSTAVQAAARKLDMEYKIIDRTNWDMIKSIQNSTIYNCTPVKNLDKIVNNNNSFIDCIVSTKTGKMLATIQANYQFKLYTGLQFPLKR
tara:strand:+ start:3698 stop:4348 length:651 start_codon:yes stop_codon:yes gene_type:complete